MIITYWYGQSIIQPLLSINNLLLTLYTLDVLYYLVHTPYPAIINAPILNYIHNPCRTIDDPTPYTLSFQSHSSLHSISPHCSPFSPSSIVTWYPAILTTSLSPPSILYYSARSKTCLWTLFCFPDHKLGSTDC